MRQFQNIQAMRGVAALIVVLVHSVAMPVDVGMGHFVALFGAVGPAGVDLFFVISGFIIATVAADIGDKCPSHDAGRQSAIFLLKRIARIYPIYWVVFGLALVAKSQGVFLAPASVPDQPIWQLILLVNPTNNIVMLAWTLVYEMYFYIIVAVALFVFPRHIYRALGVWAVITMAAILYFAMTKNPIGGRVPFNPMLAEFIMGVGIAYLTRRGITSYAIGCITLGLVWAVFGAYFNHNFGSWQPWQRTLAFGPAAALIIYGFVAVEVRNGWTCAAPWRKLGDASYSMYIWHQLIFFTLLKIAQAYGWFNAIPGHVLVPMWVAGVLIWSFISFRFIETPLRRLLERVIALALSKRKAPMPMVPQ